MSTHHLIAVFCGFLSLSAQQTPTDTVKLDEVIVTGYRIATPVRQTAKTVTVLTRADIAGRNVTNVAQLLNSVPGIIVNGSQTNAGKDKSVYLRGASSKYTLVLLNGQPLYDPSGVGGLYDLRLIGLADVERVEILRGGQSALYGADAVAGVINIITVKQNPGEFDIHGRTTIGSFNTITTNFSGLGETAGMRFQVAAQNARSDGFSEADSDGSSGFDKDHYQRRQFTFGVGVDPIENLTISSSLRLSNFDGDYDSGAFTDGNEAFTAIGRVASGELNYRSLHWSGTFRFQGASTERSFNTAFGVFDYKSETEIISLFVAANMTEWLNMLIGADIQAQRITDDAGIVKNPSVDINEFYIQTLINQVDEVTVELGLRLTSHSAFGDKLTWTAATKYRLMNLGALTLSAGSAYKTPMLSELYGAFGANPELKPEASLSWEAGYEMQDGNGFRGRITYFQRDLENVIVYDFIEGYLNRDQQRDHGVELEFEYQKKDDFRFDISADYVTGETIQSPGTDTQTKMTKLIRRPEWRFQLNGAWRMTSAFTLGTTIEYQAERDDIFFNSVTFMNDPVTLDAFTRVDIKVGYQLPFNGVQATLDVRNVFDSEIVEVYGYSRFPRTFTAGINYKF